MFLHVNLQVTNFNEIISYIFNTVLNNLVWLLSDSNLQLDHIALPVGRELMFNKLLYIKC